MMAFVYQNWDRFAFSQLSLVPNRLFGSKEFFAFTTNRLCDNIISYLFFKKFDDAKNNIVDYLYGFINYFCFEVVKMRFSNDILYDTYSLIFFILWFSLRELLEVWVSSPFDHLIVILFFTYGINGSFCIW